MSNPEPLLSEFLTTIELAAELGRNKRTLDRWNALGTGPPRTRMGRTVLYRRSSVQKWLAAQENQAGIVPWQMALTDGQLRAGLRGAISV